MKTKAFLRYALTFSVALCVTGPAFTQLTSTAPLGDGPAATNAASAPVAYVYVGTSKGINLYNAALNGKLTLVSGSPFKTTGLMIGSNQKYFISLGTYWLRSYVVKSNGAIGAQVTETNTQDFSGSECGRTNGAVLDHSGQNVYVQLNVPPDANPVCNAFQTFKIGSDGNLTFLAATTTYTVGAPPERNLPTILANGKFAYSVNDFYQPADGTFLTGSSVFAIASTGSLQYQNLFWRFPPPYQDDEEEVWFPLAVTADPTNHLAVLMHAWYAPPYGNVARPQLGSFTADSQGNISTTNTWKNMPTPDVFRVLNGEPDGPVVLNISPNGKLLAVGGQLGLEVFHFNGAAPITRYSKVLTPPVQIVSARWDKSNHLYALSANGKLYVYTITATSIAAAPGSPYTVSGPSALFVVPK